MRAPRFQLLAGRQEERGVHGKKRRRKNYLRDDGRVGVDGFHDHARVLGENGEEAHHAPGVGQQALLVQGIQETQRLHRRSYAVLPRRRKEVERLEVADAQNAVTQAEATYVQALYGYHLAVVGLEAAVGRPLR